MAVGDAGAGFRVGAVLSRSMSVLRGNFPVFGALALLFTWPTLFISDDVEFDDGTVGSTAGGVTSTPGDAGTAATVAAIVAGVVLVVLVVIALYMLATSSMVYGTFQTLRGRRVSRPEGGERGPWR